jgi:hypothetical protein
MLINRIVKLYSQLASGREAGSFVRGLSLQVYRKNEAAPQAPCEIENPEPPDDRVIAITGPEACTTCCDRVQYPQWGRSTAKVLVQT